MRFLCIEFIFEVSCLQARKELCPRGSGLHLDLHVSPSLVLYSLLWGFKQSCPYTFIQTYISLVRKCNYLWSMATFGTVRNRVCTSNLNRDDLCIAISFCMHSMLTTLALRSHKLTWTFSRSKKKCFCSACLNLEMSENALNLIAVFNRTSVEVYWVFVFQKVISQQQI